MSYFFSFAFVLLSATAMSTVAQAYTAGLSAGSGVCPYPVSGSDAIENIDTNIADANDELRDLREDLESRKSAFASADARYKAVLKRVTDAGVTEKQAIFVSMNIIDEGMKCSSDFVAPEGPTPEGKIAVDVSKSGFKFSDFQSFCRGDEFDFEKFCAKRPGNKNTKPANPYDAKYGVGTGSQSMTCDQAFTSGEFNNAAKERAEKARELADHQANIENLKLTIKRLQAERKGAIREFERERAREMRQAMTEGTYCPECEGRGGGAYPRRSNNAEVIGNVAQNVLLGAASMYFGNQIQKYVANKNAALGWPTQSYPSFGFGYPYMMGAFYGAMGGGVSSGGFGCGGGMYGSGFPNGPYGSYGPFGGAGMYGPTGSPYGYPWNMYGSPYGGGMYLPGMGPWGMNGPWGLGSGGYPGMYPGGGMMMPGGYPGGGMMMPGGMMAPGGMMLSAMAPGGFMIPGAMAPNGYMYPGMMGPGGMMMPGGYPGMMAPGGMMLSGMAPGGLMMPGAGMMMPGGYPGMMAPGGMMLSGMAPGGLMMPGAGLMMPGGYPGMYPGMMGGGMMPGAYPGMMGGGMMPGAYPGMMGGGMMPGAYPGLMGGGMMPGAYPGLMGGGMVPGYGGMPGGMMPGAGMMPGTGLDTTAMQMQMYQQLMQMQMQQYQMQVQAQQQAQAQYVAKTQVIQGLQMELYSLLNRLQQAQASLYYGGYVGVTYGSPGVGVGVGGTIGFGGTVRPQGNR